MYRNLQCKIQYFVVLRFSAISVKRFYKSFLLVEGSTGWIGIFQLADVPRSISGNRSRFRSLDCHPLVSSVRILWKKKNYKRVKWILPILGLVIITVKTGFSRNVVLLFLIILRVKTIMKQNFLWFLSRNARFRRSRQRSSASIRYRR